MSPTSSLPEWFAHAIQSLRDGNIHGWMEIYAPEAVHEFPFAPAGAIDRLEGRESIEGYMNQLPSLIQFGSLTDVLAREVDDELIIEATGHHTRLTDGSSFDLRYVWFITRQSGKVIRIRDYMNPLQLAVLSHATE